MLAGWLLAHMAGNLTLLKAAIPVALQGFESSRAAVASTADAYNAYSYMLTHNAAFIWTARIGTLVILLAHFGLAIQLFLENRRARGPVGYEVNNYSGLKTGKKRSFASFTMIFSGTWILVYLAVHLSSLPAQAAKYVTMVDGVEMHDIFRLTVEHLSSPLTGIFYVISMAIIAMHLTHAIGSAVQTAGINHPRWNTLITVVSRLYVIVVASGFAAAAVGAHLIGRNF